jgi:hypothetical protein
VECSSRVPQARISSLPAASHLSDDVSGFGIGECSEVMLRYTHTSHSSLVDPTQSSGKAPMVYPATAETPQRALYTELEEKIGDLNILHEANEEYIRTLERRNSNLWNAIRNLEEQLRASGIPFQAYENYS